jgi:hypothetical protein
MQGLCTFDAGTVAGALSQALCRWLLADTLLLDWLCSTWGYGRGGLQGKQELEMCFVQGASIHAVVTHRWCRVTQVLAG